MNLQEFKAWFEGFTENMSGVPSAKAWTRIKARVSEITEKPTEVRYFYDNYWRPYYHHYPNVSPGIVYCGTIQNAAVGSTYSAGKSYSLSSTAKSGDEMKWTSATAFQALGHADALALEQN